MRLLALETRGGGGGGNSGRQQQEEAERKKENGKPRGKKKHPCGSSGCALRVPTSAPT